MSFNISLDGVKHLYVDRTFASDYEEVDVALDTVNGVVDVSSAVADSVHFESAVEAVGLIPSLMELAYEAGKRGIALTVSEEGAS